MKKRDDIFKRELDQSRIMTLLSEKRTLLSELRTAITMFVLPLTILTVLIATSRYYNIQNNIPLLIIIGGISLILLLISIVMTVRSLGKMAIVDKKLKNEKLP